MPPGNANFSLTIVSATLAPAAASKWLSPNNMKYSGVAASAPATMPITWPTACWRGFAPSMYPGLMSMSRFEALLATSADITAVIRFVAGVRGSSAPNVNCGILDNEPDGVMPVSAVLLAAISASTRINGMRQRAE